MLLTSSVCAILYCRGSGDVLLDVEDILCVGSKPCAARHGLAIAALVQQVSRLLKLLLRGAQGDLAHIGQVFYHAFRLDGRERRGGDAVCWRCLRRGR